MEVNQFRLAEGTNKGHSHLSVRPPVLAISLF
jgi:hypothetical protein